MPALAFRTAAAAAEHAQPPPAGLIPLTRNEIASATQAGQSLRFRAQAELGPVVGAASHLPRIAYGGPPGQMVWQGWRFMFRRSGIRFARCRLIARPTSTSLQSGPG